MRFFLGAFGDAGHAFPMLAVAEALRDRGHTVAIETWKQWRDPAEAAGLEFVAAPEYHVFPTRERPNRGANGYHRVGMRHGVSTITRGSRTALGIIFHDAS